MRLPIQPKTVKPKIMTIAKTIQSSFMLAPSPHRGVLMAGIGIESLRKRD